MFKKNVKKVDDITVGSSNLDKLNDAKKNNIKIKEKMKWKNRKLYMIITIIVITILVIASIITIYLNNKKFNLYLKYEEKMQTYGFDIMYNNKTAKTSESVTKAEALKLALCAVFNIDDISIYTNENNEYENATWVQFAKDSGITTEDININNFNHNVKYIDVITYFQNCKTKFLEGQTIKDTEMNIEDINKYTTDKQVAIKDMLENKIIYLINNSFNGNQNIFKGQLNELVVNYVEKYNTIAPKGEKLNINPEKLPSNAEEYPYTLSSINKSVYEKPFFPGYDIRKKSPKETYNYKKDSYLQIEVVTENFFNELLNIDYKTITEESLRNKLEPYLVYKANDSTISEYVKHVKDNEIIIEGSSQLQYPIIYYDGISYRARLRIKFEVKHSNTKESLLYLDMLDKLKETYEVTSYDILVDYYLASALGNNNTYISERTLYETILDVSKCGITKEVYNPIITTEEKVM